MELATHMFPLTFLSEFNQYVTQVTQSDVLRKDQKIPLITNLASFIGLSVLQKDWGEDKINCANNITAVCVYALYDTLVHSDPDHWQNPKTISLYFSKEEIKVSRAERGVAAKLLKKVGVEIEDKKKYTFERPGTTQV